MTTLLLPRLSAFAFALSVAATAACGNSEESTDTDDAGTADGSSSRGDGSSTSGVAKPAGCARSQCDLANDTCLAGSALDCTSCSAFCGQPFIDSDSCQTDCLASCGTSRPQCATALSACQQTETNSICADAPTRTSSGDAATSCSPADVVSAPPGGSMPADDPTCTQAEVDSIAAVATFDSVPLSAVTSVSASCQSCALSPAAASSWGLLVQVNATTVMVNYSEYLELSDEVAQKCGIEIEQASACLALACQGCDTDECRAAALVGPCARYQLDAACLKDATEPGYVKAFPHRDDSATGAVSALLSLFCVPG